MNDGQSQDRFIKEVIDLFSDPAFNPLNKDSGNLFPPDFSTPLRLALWLEYFLIAGEGPLKEKWASLPLEEQTDLGIELLKCYLFQPLYIRLSKEEKSPAIKSPLRLKSQGKLFRVEHGSGTNRKIELLYLLDHLRFWPDLFRLFPEDFFSSEKVLKVLEPGIILASSSRLEKIRQRAETLGSFFLKGKSKGISADLLTGDQSKTKNATEDTSGQVHGDDHPPKKIEPIQPAPGIPDLHPSPLPPPKRKKKSKSSKDQMELF